MTVEELIEKLKYYDGELEVRFASQPSWPFEYSINGVVRTTIREHNNRYEAVYLEEGRQLGYLPKEAKEELGW